ncbi:endonuclease/exonuclease/phosphatase family protein [Micromonospora sp. NPDC048170]|uniref:endonuclease/exonuclease/phosphatase family protein n=1 Tax=Micromonospora sp. NPDC048170 TaxID=3154819 RepID=UPI0033D1399D
MVLALAGSLTVGAGATVAAGWPAAGRSATVRPVEFASPAPAPPPPIPLTVLTWNVCANGKLRCLAGRQHQQLASAIGAAARNGPADVLLLQEMCADLLPAMERSLGAGWKVYFRQASTAAVRHGTLVDRPATCEADGNRYGQAVAVRLFSPDTGRASTVQASWLVELPSPKPVGSRWMERRSAVCVRLRAPRVQVCGAHLSTPQQDPDGRVRAAQAARLAAEARRGHERGYPTIIGGDLNTTPATTVAGSRQQVLQPLYDQGADCDLGRMRPTFGSIKIDYLFAGAGVTPLGCTVTPTSLSDHRMISARYHLRPDPIQRLTSTTDTDGERGRIDG